MLRRSPSNPYGLTELGAGDPAAVQRDVAESYVSLAGAGSTHGVVVDPGSPEVDLPRTEALRRARSSP